MALKAKLWPPDNVLVKKCSHCLYTDVYVSFCSYVDICFFMTFEIVNLVCAVKYNSGEFVSMRKQSKIINICSNPGADNNENEPQPSLERPSSTK